MHSALYLGRLEHRRLAPAAHGFRYRVCFVWLDLGELDDVFRGRWLWSARRPALTWLRRADHLGDPRLPLDVAVRDRVERETGRRPAGPVRLLTQLRSFGLCFNPVSFWYCYDTSGRTVEFIVAEVSNTPWNERHTYVLRAPAQPAPAGTLRFQLTKAFHVSPFMPMDIDYEWHFTPPASGLAVHIVNRRAGQALFTATLALQRREITGASLAGALARFPCPALQVLGAIYWQAFRLWARGVPFQAHPAGHSSEKTT